MSATAAPRPLVLRRRRIARALAWVLCLVAAVPYFGIQDLVTLFGWVDQRWEWPISLDVSWGVLFTFLLAGGYAWIGVRPHDSAPGLAALGIAGIALAAGAAAGGQPEPLPIAVVVLASAAGLALLTRPAWGGADWRISWPYLVLAVLGAVLWLPYTASALAQSRLGTGTEITNGVDHWPVQAAAGMAILLASAALAVWRPGRPLLRVAVSFSAGLIGVAALAYPDRDGATEGDLWAIAAVLWGLAVSTVQTGVRRGRDVRDLEHASRQQETVS
ncbi:hypothetical protein [Naasia sp. SYSU D00057]|uniref:hypothetical protein n=1 Tax=Naasia sp. SYSU D00057 TaxID=2817380 RepID=UPI001B317449|nr:hypothetical protein [Naasia sp. SYSU D00057]